MVGLGVFFYVGFLRVLGKFDLGLLGVDVWFLAMGCAQGC